MDDLDVRFLSLITDLGDGMKRSKLMPAVGGLLTCGLLIASVGPANADDAAPSASAATSAVADVPGIQDYTVPATQSPANVPTDPNDPVTFDGGAVGVTVPSDGTTRTVSSGGMTVYQVTDTAASTVVQPTDSGARFMTVISGPFAPSDYRYNLDVPAGGSVVQNPDGSISVRDEQGDQVAGIAPPWATDANGKSLPTSYSVDGTEITQHVTLGGAAFPVVADPAVTVDCGWITRSYYLSRAVTKKIADKLARYQNASTATIAAIAGAACAPATSVAAAICAGAGAIYGGFMVDQFLAAKRQNKCIRYRVLRGGSLGGIYVDGSGFCKNS